MFMLHFNKAKPLIKKHLLRILVYIISSAFNHFLDSFRACVRSFLPLRASFHQISNLNILTINTTSQRQFLSSRKPVEFAESLIAQKRRSFALTSHLDDDARHIWALQKVSRFMLEI